MDVVSWMSYSVLVLRVNKLIIISNSLDFGLLRSVLEATTLRKLKKYRQPGQL